MADNHHQEQSSFLQGSLERGHIEQHDIPDTTKKEQQLLIMLQNEQPIVIEHLRKTFYSRVETIVNNLRNKGHKIDTSRGRWTYLHGPTTDWPRTSKTTQQLYYSTNHWKAASRKRIEGDGKCQQCHVRHGPGVVLNAHHWRYNLFNENVRYDLMTLCKQCHQDLHLVIKGCGVFFPKRLPQKMIDRIKFEAQRDNHGID